MRKILLVLILFSLVAPAASAPPVDTVIAGTAMRTPRAAHSATYLLDGTVLIAGGMVEEQHNLDSAELYDPATAAFTPTGSLVTARVSHTATLLLDGTVLIAGGWGRQVLSSAERYDPQTGMFAATGDLTMPRSAFTATRLHDGRVLITGGYYQRRMFATAEIYDPKSSIFTAINEMNVARASHTASLLADGRVLITGGGWDGTVLDSAEIYDPVTGQFSLTGVMTIPRYKHANVSLPDGRVLVIGGSSSSDWRGRYASTEIYDPETETFTAAATMADERFKLSDAVVVLDDGQVVVAGASPTVEVYDPLRDAFLQMAGSIDIARFYATATTLDDGSVLVAGGYDSDIAATANTWVVQAGE